MYVEQEGGDNAVKIKAVVLPKMNQMQGSPGVMKVQGAPGTPSGPGPKTTVQEISTGELKNFKILVAPNGTQLPSRVRSPMSPAQGQRLLNVATNIRQVNVGVSQEFRIMPGCGSPRPQYVQSPRPRNMTPRPPTLLQRSMSPRPQQMYNRMPPPNQQVCDNPMEPPPPSMESTPAPAVEEEKDQYKAGFLALCSNCGSLSARTNRCNRCNHKIPPDCKLVSSNGNPTAGGGAGPKGGKDTPASPGDSKNSPKPANAVNSPSHPSTDTAPATPNPPSGTKTRARKAQEEPPEILLISSDEEDDGESENKHTPAKSFPTPLSDKEPQMNEYEMPQNIRVCGGGIPDDNVLDTLSEDGRYTHLLCRTIRIGSLKVFPTERVFISRHGIKLTLPLNQTQVTVKIYRHEIVKVLAHFGKGMPVIFYYIRARVGPRIREQLNMTKNSKFYFDPSSPDETHRRITLLPEKIPDEVKCILSDIYSKTSSGSEEPQDGPCLEELSIKEANNILVKSSPPELRNVNSAAPPIPAPVSQPVQTIYIYKPTGISINTEDYACLDKEQFINDVIIDFYLGFLLQEMATPHIREKTHIFSTFFYKRLTQKPTRKISGSIEGDPHISAAKKRHSRVQSWTKNINVFEKDFIVVPINSNAHWFLAIICFPGLKGCETPEGRAVEECQRFRSLRKRERIKLDEMQKTGKASGSVTIGNTTISPVTKAPGTPASTDPAAATSLLVNDEEEENRDEAESEGEDFVQFGEESQEAAAGATSSGERAQSPLRDFDGPVRHPCILIFDSLPQAGNSRVRVVATLRDWLAVEYQVKHGGATRDFSKNVFIGAKPKVPMQTNYYDCGLYLLHYAERFFLDPLTDYRMPILLEDCRMLIRPQCNLFTNLNPEIDPLRYDLQHLLFVLMERQGIDRNSLNLPHLNLDDPDYKSPEHEPEAIESKYSASQDSQEEEGREEAEGEEMGDEEEEEEELEEGEIRGGRRGGEATNCDNNSSTEDADIELQMKVVEEEVSDEQDTTVSECTEVDEPCSEEEEKAASTPLARGNTKQITITPMGVKLKQISVTPALNSPTVQIVHIPRPRSKQILVHSPAAGGASAVPARRILVPSSVESPGAGSASPARRILVPSSESPGAGTGTPARRIVVPSESPGAGTPPPAKKLVIPADKDSLDLLKNNKNITVKRKLGPASALKKSPPLGGTGAGGNSLRNMRIVKKMKTEDSGGVEEEEEIGS
ncbi:hypothetical protein M8J76_015139 [Diaphorina citri]|nr:hypothetical protein M8J76_015139 [Diaphorina citri]